MQHQQVKNGCCIHKTQLRCPKHAQHLSSPHIPMKLGWVTTHLPLFPSKNVLDITSLSEQYLKHSTSTLPDAGNDHLIAPSNNPRHLGTKTYLQFLCLCRWNLKQMLVRISKFDQTSIHVWFTFNNMDARSLQPILKSSRYYTLIILHFFWFAESSSLSFIAEQHPGNYGSNLNISRGH